MGKSVFPKSSPSEQSMFKSLSNLLSNDFLCRDETDSCIWMPSLFGAFSIRSIYSSMEELSGASIPCSLIRCSLAPLGVEIFCQLGTFRSGGILSAGSFRQDLDAG